ncbi:MAG: calcium-binding protein [Planctomycetales bacterium]|nr:calcium-binding protein [Planctomycetales bacterium]
MSNLFAPLRRASQVFRSARCSNRRRRVLAARHRLIAEQLEDRRMLNADPIDTSLDRSAWQEISGADDGVVRIAVTLDEAINREVRSALDGYRQHLDAGHGSEPFDIAPLKLRLSDFENFEQVLHHGNFTGAFDNVIVGTWRSETLVGTDARDLMVGLGGNDIIEGGGNDDILIGGSGNDILRGESGNDTMLYSGTREGYDALDGGIGDDQAVAVTASTVIGVNGYENGVELLEGPGDTVVRDTYHSHTLDFASTRIDGIAEIDASSGNDDIIASNLSSAAYRGGGGNDTLTAGSQTTTWLYAGDSNGYDTLQGNTAGALVTAVAETAGTVFGVDGYSGGVDAFAGNAAGDTVVRDNYRGHLLDFSATELLLIAEIDAGSGNDDVIASNLSSAAYRGGSGNDTLTAGSQTTTWLYAGDSNGYDTFRENGDTVTVLATAESANTVIGVDGYANEVDEFVGYADGDTVIRDNYRSHLLDFSGTQLTHIAEVDAASGNDIIIASDLSEARYRGGSGNDELIAGSQDTTWLYSGDRGGYDTLSGNGAATVTAISESPGTVIGVSGYENGVDEFRGHASGDTILLDTYHSHVLDLSNTRLTQIAEVNAGAGHDTIVASDISLGRYRGESGNDTLHAGLQATVWLYSGDRNGYDVFRDNNDALVIAVAEAAGTVIGVNSYENGVDLFEGHADGDTIVRDNYLSNLLDFSATAFQQIAEVDASSGNDTIVASDLDPLAYRGGPGNDTLIAGEAGTTWLYNGINDGRDTFEHNHRENVLAQLERDPIPSGPIAGTTGTALDRLVDVILADPGLASRISQDEIQAGADAANSLNQIIVDGIRATGLANNGAINAADLRDLNTWIQANEPARWAVLHGDDEGDVETGFHLVQNDGATSYLFGANDAVNTVADGLYHIGFDIVGGRFLNEDGDRNVSVTTAAYWLDTILRDDLASGALSNASVDPYAIGETGTGLDDLVKIITADPELNRRIPTSELMTGANSAFAMNQIIVEAIRATGIANDATINTADVRDLNAWIRLHQISDWTSLHGDDEDNAETGFHLVQNDGATTRLYGNNAVNTVADGIYHLGFLINGNRLQNEDGNDNARVETVAAWLTSLLAADLAGGVTLVGAANAYAVGSTGTGLDTVVETIAADPGLNERIATSEITGGARAADEMNQIILTGIRETGVADDRALDTADVYVLNSWIQANEYSRWVDLHGDDEDGATPGETGFHLVQNDGALSRMFGQNAVNTVFDGIYHLGFDIENGRFLNEDGNANARVETVAYWLSSLLESELAAGSLSNQPQPIDRASQGSPAMEARSLEPLAASAGTTATGLDLLIDIILADPGLASRIPRAEIEAGADFADQLNQIIVEAIRATGLGNDGVINPADMHGLNAWIQQHRYDDWVALHGDDEDGQETGFHLVQNDGAKTRLFAQNAVNTVADGLYHIGFAIDSGRFLNEDGNRNVSVETAAWWLNDLLKDDLADGSLFNSAVNPYAEGTTGTGLDLLVLAITSDPGLNRRISTADITGGATAADAMSNIIVAAIRAAGSANDGEINAADVREINRWIRTNYGEDVWAELHGDDEDGEETGFHLVQNDGATSRLFGNNAVNTIADGIFHLGFAIQGNNLLNEDGDANASVEKVAWWLDELLSADLASGALANLDVEATPTGSTGTGLDTAITMITSDPGLNRKISTGDIAEGARAADAMNQLLVEAIRATGAADDGRLDRYDVVNLNVYLQARHADEWENLHGDDEGDEETGFHLVQNDGATAKIFGDLNAINTVLDGIYHAGFDIRLGQFENEDGDRNARLEDVAWWLTELLWEDLRDGSLASTPEAASAVAAQSVDAVFSGLV